jgi:translation initiation factor 2A
LTPLFIAVFTPETSGMPSKINLYKHEGSSTSEVSCRTSFSASSATFYWNLRGNKLLVHTHSDIDRAGTSYYGSTGLFLISTDGTISEKVPQTKEGPIHDVQWSPLGDTFIVCAGSMPAQITLYNENGQATYEFGAAHRNTISWSPHGRFLMIGGFGNLQGEMDFYDMRRVKKIASKTAHCTVGLDWSPCSRYLLTSTTAPRMNVDNGFKIFKYNGEGPICHKQLNVAYNVKWLPTPVSSYPNRGPSPKRKADGNSTSVVAETKPAVGFYRPPGASSAFAERIAKEHGKSGVVGKIKQPTPAASKPKEPAVKERVIPGLVEQDKKKKVEPTKETKNPVKDQKVEKAPQVNEKEKTLTPSEMNDEEKGKRVKAIQKKLKQIDEIKDKVKSSGVALNADQKLKMDSEASLIAELNELLKL